MKFKNLEEKSTLLGWIDAEYSVLALPPTVEAKHIVVKLVRRSPSRLQKIKHYVEIRQMCENTLQMSCEHGVHALTRTFSYKVRILHYFSSWVSSEPLIMSCEKFF